MQKDPTKGNTSECGGTILDEETILSAAHCFYDNSTGQVQVYKSSQVKVEVGFTTHINKTHPKKRHVRKYYTHPNYNPHTSDNDIAILKLKRPLTFWVLSQNYVDQILQIIDLLPTSVYVG